MKRNSVKAAVLAMVVLPGMLSCRKDLCYDHNHSANVTINLNYSYDWYTHAGITPDPSLDIDWPQVIPTDPDGVRLIDFHQQEGLSPKSTNMAPSGAKINMRAGYHDLLFYNNDTEYIEFDGNGMAATASTRTRTRISHSVLYPEETTKNAPDMLYAAYLQNLYVEDIPEDDPHAQLNKFLNVRLTPRVFTYVVFYEFASGLEYVVQARGSLSAMAGSVYLATGHTEEDPVTVLFDCGRKAWGYQTTLRSFGVPGIRFEESRAESSDVILSGDHILFDRNEADMGIQVETRHTHRLILELYLVNNKEKLIEFDVTEQLRQQPRGGVIVVKDIVVTPEEASTDGGGFDTEVDGWEDDEIVNIPIS